MRNVLLVFTCVLVLVITATAMERAGPHVDDDDDPGVFSGIEVGQRVALRDHGTAYEIKVLSENLPLSHEVVAVGEDYLVVRAGVMTITIPSFALKCVVRVNLDPEPPEGAE